MRPISLKLLGLASLILGIAGYFRFYSLGSIPAGYSWDEMSMLYNGWSISWWHRDENAVKMPLTFTSFGDYKPPLIIYLLAGINWLGVKSEIVIRVISAIAGVLSVLVLGLIAYELTSNKKQIGLISMLMLAITPWSIFFSRVGFEQNLTFLLVLMGVFGLIKGINKSNYYYFASVAFGLSFYSFHTAKIFVPLFYLLFARFYWSKIRQQKNFGKAFVVWLLICSPIIFLSFTGDASKRAQTLIFFSQSGMLQSGGEIFKNLLTNLRAFLQLDFWLRGQDAIGIRHMVPGHGVIYYTELILVFVGSIKLSLENRRKLYFLWCWLIIGLLPSILTNPAPHALRSLFALAPLIILSSFGVLWFRQQKQMLIRIVGVGVGLVLTLEISQFWRVYLTEYGNNSATAYAFGYKEVLEKAKPFMSGKEKVVVSDRYGQPYVYVLWYEKITPQNYQFGALNNYEFRPIHWLEENNKRLYLGTPAEIPLHDPGILDRVTLPGTDEIIWLIAEK